MIAFIAYNMGGGIEHQAIEIRKILNDIAYPYKEYTAQNPAHILFQWLVETSPDVIIINEPTIRTIEATYYYSLTKKVSVLLFFHGSLKSDAKTKDQQLIFDNLTRVSRIFILAPKEKTQYIDIPYMLVDPEEYNIRTPWKERRNTPVFTERLIPQKFANEVRKAKPSDIQIECYSDKFEGEDVECTKYDKIEQKNMPMVLNKYRYALFPYGGDEIFSITLLQSILTGTIPLVYTAENSTWIKWADGLYFGSHNPEQYWQGVRDIINRPESEVEYISLAIRQKAVSKFRYKYWFEYIKQKILEVL